MASFLYTCTRCLELARFTTAQEDPVVCYDCQALEKAEKRAEVVAAKEEEEPKEKATKK
jgi:hypothetical protein